MRVQPWPLGLSVLLGNFLSIQGNIQFPFPVPRVGHLSEGSHLCGCVTEPNLGLLARA